MTSPLDVVNGAPESTWTRFIELVEAPLNEPDMLWFAIPLLIATIMMSLYFGRYRKEELGWNSAFANTMVFIFVSIDIIRRMYESTTPYSWMNIWDNPLYLMITLALGGFGILSMITIYYHLLPKQITFKLFWNLPVNIAVYVIMCVVYAGVTLDQYTVFAGILLFVVVWLLLKFLQWLQGLSGKRLKEAEEGTWEKEGKNPEYKWNGGDAKRSEAPPEENGEEPIPQDKKKRSARKKKK